MIVCITFLFIAEFITLFCYWIRKDYKKMTIYGVLMLIANIAFCWIYSIDPGEVYQLAQGLFDAGVLYRVINNTYKLMDLNKDDDESNK